MLCPRTSSFDYKQVGKSCQPLDGGDVLVRNFAHSDAAGAHRSLADQNRTGPTLLDAQPYLIPVRSTVSRMAQSSGVSGSKSRVCCFPLMLRVVISTSLVWGSVIQNPCGGSAVGAPACPWRQRPRWPPPGRSAGFRLRQVLPELHDSPADVR